MGMTPEGKEKALQAARRGLRAKKEQRLEAYDKAPTLCGKCQEALPYLKRHNKFCSRSCAAQVSNLGVDRYEKRRGGELLQRRNDCRHCGNLLNRSWVKKYCNQVCAKTHINHLWIQRWLNGEEDGRKGVGGTSVRIRKWMISTHGEKCSQCGWAEVHSVTGNIPIQLDHIDGDWKNNRPENLRFLCPNCHSLTATYGALNTGSGRSYRYLKRIQTQDPTAD